MTNTRPSSAVEAEMALAEITGLAWRGGQTTWHGHVIAYTSIAGITFPGDARTVLYAPGGERIAVGLVSGVTERELRYKTLAWGIGKVIAARAAR